MAPGLTDPKSYCWNRNHCACCIMLRWPMRITMKMLCYLLFAFSLLPPVACAQPTPHLMTFAGDSIMQGTASAASLNIVPQLATLEPEWNIRNYSVAGASVSGGPIFPPMDPHAIVPLLGDTIVVFLGTNDWAYGTNWVTFYVDYYDFIQVLQYLHPQIVCVTPIWRVGEGSLNSAGYDLATTRLLITDACTSLGHPTIDGLTLVPNDPAYFDSTGVHPNDAGYNYMTNGLAAALGALVP